MVPVTFSAGSPVYSIETFPQRQLPDAMIDLSVYVIDICYALRLFFL
jgi:hypothetical protein